MTVATVCFSELGYNWDKRQILIISFMLQEGSGLVDREDVIKDDGSDDEREDEREEGSKN